MSSSAPGLPTVPGERVRGLREEGDRGGPDRRQRRLRRVRDPGQVRGLKVAGVRLARSPADGPRYRGRRIAVVVPAYNEEELIGEVLDGIPDYVAKVYAVDDGSADRTGEIIEDYARRDSRIVPIHHNPNRGVGAAITSGYKRAVEDGMDIAAVMAGDNQMDPAYLPDLLDPIVDGRADYTKGNRLINEAYRKGMSPVAEFRELPPHLPHQGRLGLLADDGPPERLHGDLEKRSPSFPSTASTRATATATTSWSG
jgi:hypothetical protein